MKDTIITVKTKKRELKILLVCFAVAFAVNVYAIIAFDRGWEELLTQIGFVVAITLVLYFAAAIIRLAVRWTAKIFGRK